MHGIFITGTDTGIGKTIVTAAIVSILRRAGIDAAPMKPVQTGCLGSLDRLASPDLDFCLAAARMSPSASERALMCPYRFKDACSPHLAAARAHTKLRLPDMRKALLALSRMHRFMVVEGAGGIMAPVSGKKTMLDLMQTYSLPVVLVARSGLGTINHVLLSLHRIREAGLEVAGVVMNRTQPDTPQWIEKDNRATIERLGKTRILGLLPFRCDLDTGNEPPVSFQAWCSRHMTGVMELARRTS